jgi:hypothetical protein
MLHLCSSKENQTRNGMGSTYIFCDEIDSYYAEVKANGAAVTFLGPDFWTELNESRRGGRSIGSGVIFQRELERRA